MTDPYRTLEVSPDADFDAIQAAYRRLMREHHPDRAGGASDAELRARAINAAFALLKDSNRRAAYDAQRFNPRPPPARPTVGPSRPIVRRRGPSLAERQQRLARVRWFRRGLLVGACALIGVGVAGAVMSYRASDAPWLSNRGGGSTEARPAAVSDLALADRVG